jgi:alpha-D-ribose 1-methylphosphonate 5-triphosphate synthase subunit PhnG
LFYGLFRGGCGLFRGGDITVARLAQHAQLLTTVGYALGDGRDIPQGKLTATLQLVAEVCEHVLAVTAIGRASSE